MRGTDMSTMEQDERHSSLQLYLKYRDKPQGDLYISMRNNILIAGIKQVSIQTEYKTTPKDIKYILTI